MKILCKNKKALYDYNILETYEAGLKLLGPEVKSIKNNAAKLKGSFVKIHNQEALLINAHIPAYQPKNTLQTYDPERSRKLLLHKKEIISIANKTKEKGLTLIPIKLYTKKGKIKLEFAIAKGKKKFDKRAAIKKREFKREKLRIIKQTGLQ